MTSGSSTRDTGRLRPERAAPGWVVLAFAPGLMIVFCLVLYPLGLAVWTSLRLGAGGPNLGQYAALLTGPAGPAVVLRTIGLALATVAGSAPRSACWLRCRSQCRC